MKNERLGKFLLFLFLGLFVAGGVGMTVLFRQTYREYTNTKAREAYYRQRLSEAEAKLKEKEEALHRLRHDPLFAERVIRERRGWVREGELLFNFDELEDGVKWD